MLRSLSAVVESLNVHIQLFHRLRLFQGGEDFPKCSRHEVRQLAKSWTTDYGSK